MGRAAALRMVRIGGSELYFIQDGAGDNQPESRLACGWGRDLGVPWVSDQGDVSIQRLGTVAIYKQGRSIQMLGQPVQPYRCESTGHQPR